MRYIFLLFPLVFLACKNKNDDPTFSHPKFEIPHEKDDNTTATYEEAIDWYIKIDNASPKFKMRSHGLTAVETPLHLAILSADGDFNPASNRAKGKRVLLINNAIHPGEPCGVDASMLLIRDLLANDSLEQILENVVLAFIPIFNVGGSQNRNAHSRANQNGPKDYGFRGNAQNLDLNRDFIKADSRNAKSFAEIIQEWQPDVFIDNHTSNGADYQYVMTMIATQHNKLGGELGRYLNKEMMPRLHEDMAEAGWEMSPYVYARTTPDEGIAGFLDSPRYSTGFTTLFNTIGFVAEAHMLKPYPDRVKATYTFMEVMAKLLNGDEGVRISQLRKTASEKAATQTTFDLDWEVDLEKVDSFLFKGYTAKKKPSEVSGLPRLYYDREEPYEKMIPYYNNYKATTTATKPKAYIIPQAWRPAIDRLQWSLVPMTRLQEDQEMLVEVYFIEDFETVNLPYEGHYLHSNVKIRRDTQKLLYRAGDYLVNTDHSKTRLVVETLEPQAPDSYFNWGFFDAILQQKEHFSPYVFEDLAADILKKDPALRAQLEAKKAKDKEFAESAYAQLEFVYKNSVYYEATHRRYPVARVLE